MNALEKIKLNKLLTSAVNQRDMASNALKKIKILKEIESLRKKLGMMVVKVSKEEVNPNKLPELVLPENASRKDLEKLVKQWLKNNVQGKVITTSDGKKIRFNRDQSVEHLAYDGRRSKIAAKAITKIVEVFQSGKFIERQESYKKRQDSFIAFHLYEKEVLVDEQKVLLQVKAGEKENGELETLPDLIAYTYKGVFDALDNNAPLNLPSSFGDRDYQELVAYCHARATSSGVPDANAVFDDSQVVSDNEATLTIVAIRGENGEWIPFDEWSGEEDLSETIQQTLNKATIASWYTFDENRIKTQRQKDNNAVFELLDKLDNGEILPENVYVLSRENIILLVKDTKATLVVILFIYKLWERQIGITP